MTTNLHSTPRIWIGCLAAYNGGDLHGRWVDADDAEEIEQARAEIIRTSPAWKHGGFPEEHAIMDYDGFGSLSHTLGEWPDLEILAIIGRAIREHGHTFIAYIETYKPDLDKHVTINDAGSGDWTSERDYAEHLIARFGS